MSRNDRVYLWKNTKHTDGLNVPEFSKYEHMKVKSPKTSVGHGLLLEESLDPALLNEYLPALCSLKAGHIGIHANILII